MLTLLKDFLEDPRIARPRGRKILRKLIDSGRPVTFDELFSLIWGHRADGGPLDPDNIVTIEVHHLRKNLKPGVRIRSQYGRGYVLELTESFAEQTLLRSVARKLGLPVR